MVTDATAQVQAAASEPGEPRRRASTFVEREVDLVDRIGNRIVGAGLLALAVAWTAGTFGVPFLLELSVVASVVLGLRMMRGAFGASGLYGGVMVVASLAAAILFLFVAPTVGFALRVGYSAWLLGGALGKFLDLW